MNPQTLTGKARRHLRALGHHRKPLVHVGKDGVSPSLVEALKIAIEDHELIKVKLGENAAGDRHVLSEELAAAAKAHLIGMIGRTFLLYRQHSTNPVIELPKAGGAKKPPKRA